MALLRPRANRGQLLAGAMCAVLGFALVIQVRQEDAPLTSLRNSEVIALLQEVTKRSSQLQSQAADLQSQLEALRGGADKEGVARQVAAERLQTYSVLAGTQAVLGPGIELSIEDPRGAMTSASLLDAVQELRGAGAEAIQVGDVRVVAETAFLDSPTGAGLTVGSRRVSPPYTILAIGDAQSLSRALAIPGGILEQLRSRSLVPQVDERAEVTITAVHQPPEPHYARPAPSASAGN